MNFAAIAVVLLAMSGDSPSLPSDADRDGLPDRLESELLVRFAPSFRISPADCAGLPITVAAGSSQLRAVAGQATIYGQAFPIAVPGRSGAFIELHYYHLWGRDCGRMSHPLDVEHVSALVRADESRQAAEDWSAVYWYAAAHEGTVCSAVNGARAAALGAERKGPGVWISRGKHASYLSQELCGKGCGADSCADSIALVHQPVVNIGEPGAPLNGATWTSARAWRVESKMASNFSPGVLAALDAGSGGPSLLNGRTRKQAVIAAGDASLDGLATGRRETGEALSTADAHTDRALDRAANSATGWLKRTAAGVRALGKKK